MLSCVLTQGQRLRETASSLPKANSTNPKWEPFLSLHRGSFGQGDPEKTIQFCVLGSLSHIWCTNMGMGNFTGCKFYKVEPCLDDFWGKKVKISSFLICILKGIFRTHSCSPGHSLLHYPTAYS